MAWSIFFADVAIGQVNELFQSCIIWEDSLVFGYLPDLTVIPFYCIGCVDKFPDHGRILEIFGKAFPIVFPGFDDNRILFSPFGFQTLKLSLSSLFAYSGIYPLQISQKHFLILAANILQRVAYLMNDTQLYIGFRKDTFWHQESLSNRLYR